MTTRRGLFGLLAGAAIAPMLPRLPRLGGVAGRVLSSDGYTYSWSAPEVVTVSATGGSSFSCSMVLLGVNDLVKGNVVCSVSDLRGKLLAEAPIEVSMSMAA